MTAYRDLAPYQEIGADTKGQTKRRWAMKYTVTANKFHGGRVLYSGNSENQAIRAARKHDCTECKCGGPTIERDDGAILMNWHAAKPFRAANDMWWETF